MVAVGGLSVGIRDLNFIDASKIYTTVATLWNVDFQS